MQLRLTRLLLILSLFSIAKVLFADGLNLSASTNMTHDISISTNAADKIKIPTVSEEFEGLHNESLIAVKKKTTSPSPIILKKDDFSWDIHWDNGLRYELARKNHLRWGYIFGNREKEIKDTGIIGLKLDLDATIHDDIHGFSEPDESLIIRHARLYTAGYYFFIFPLFYKVEADISASQIYIREVFLWFSHVPYVQTLKFGHFKTPSTLENMISGRDRSFMENSAPVEAFAQGTKVGIQLSDSLTEKHITWAAGLFANGNESDTSDASDSSSRLICRATCAPHYNIDTKSLLHLGYSGSLVYTGNNTVRYRSRPESYLMPRLVDTGDIPAQDAGINAIEFAIRKNNISFQSEYIHATVSAKEENVEFFGAYGSCNWCLTGEPRPYLSDRGVFGQIIPRRDFSMHSDGWGAWELALRYSYLDLNDKDIDGGQMSTGSAGMNWYLNRSVSMRVNLIYSDVTGGESPGHAVIGQTRLSIHF